MKRAGLCVLWVLLAAVPSGAAASDVPTEVHVRTGAQISALIAGGSAKITYVQGVVARGTSVSDRLVCIEITSSQGFDYGCSTDPSSHLSTDLLLNSGSADVTVPSEIRSGSVLRAKVAVHGVGSYIVERPVTLTVGSGSVSPHITAKMLRNGTVTGTVTSSSVGGGTLMAGSSAVMFQGGEAATTGRPATTTRESASTAGVQGLGESYRSAVSADGRYIAFESTAANLIPGDTNLAVDVFVRDRLAGVTIRASTSPSGGEVRFANSPGISANGRYVVFFASVAPTEGLFVRDLVTGQVALACICNQPATTPAISGDGRYIASLDGGFGGVTIYDRLLAQQSVLAECGFVCGSVTSIAFSADGRRIVWSSSGSGYVPGDDNGVSDVFVRDLPGGPVTRVSVSSLDAQGDGASTFPAITPDGRFVTFISTASTLVPGDDNTSSDVFVRDLLTGTTSVVSYAFDGTLPGIGPPAPEPPAISADGRFVAFSSASAALVAGDDNNARDVFVHDRATGRTVRVSLSADGAQADGASGRPSISADGRVIVFESIATNLSAGDLNGGPGRPGSDVYARFMSGEIA